MGRSVSTTTTNRAIARALEAWFKAARRDLPWRAEPRDPYHALVSEAMLQQTQVSRVVEKFGPFIARFPTVQALARAPEDDVLAEWSGLGYYRRARNLHAAAKQIVADHAGTVPGRADQLIELKGVGRYTAGAIASIAFNERTPIVDGNVQRVVLRLDGEALALGSRESDSYAWQRAGDLVGVCDRPSVFNEALMELGATVCTPRSPRCPTCPLREHCRARAAGTQEDIPAPKAKVKRRELFLTCALVRDSAGRLLVEQRDDSSLWAGMWEPPSIERDDRHATPEELSHRFGLTVAHEKPTMEFTHQTTHRIVRFRVYEAGTDGSWVARHSVSGATARSDATCPGSQIVPTWLTPEELASRALSNPHRRMLLGQAPATRPGEASPNVM